MNLLANDPEILSLMKISDTNGNVVPWSYNAFPDGQVQIKLNKNDIDNVLSKPNFYPFDVKVSISNPIILDLFNQFKDMFNIRNLTVNYLYGARCDKDISGDYYVCNVASKMSLEMVERCLSIQFLAPHCSSIIHPAHFNFKLPDCVNLSDYDCVVFPDESAYRRYANQLGACQFTICEKHRDQETGAIISHQIPNLPTGAKKVILIDDLCDGGGTFINVSKELPNIVEADLFVFHGVLSNNALERLMYYFDKVIVSNSLPAPQSQYDNLTNDLKNRVKIFDVWN